MAWDENSPSGASVERPHVPLTPHQQRYLLAPCPPTHPTPVPSQSWNDIHTLTWKTQVGIECMVVGRGVNLGSFKSFFFNSHLRTCSLVLEWEEERKGGGERRGQERRGCERNIHQLPPAGTLTGDQTQPRYMHWPGIEPATFGAWDDSSTNCATRPGLTLFLFTSAYTQRHSKALV